MHPYRYMVTINAASWEDADTIMDAIMDDCLIEDRVEALDLDRFGNWTIDWGLMP